MHNDKLTRKYHICLHIHKLGGLMSRILGLQGRIPTIAKTPNIRCFVAKSHLSRFFRKQMFVFFQFRRGGCRKQTLSAFPPFFYTRASLIFLKLSQTLFVLGYNRSLSSGIGVSGRVGQSTEQTNSPDRMRPPSLEAWQQHQPNHYQEQNASSYTIIILK